MRKYNLIGLFSKFAPSIIIFLAGTGTLFLVDVIISRSPTDGLVAEWAALRSYMMVTGVLTLLGLEQLVIREPHAYKIILRVLIPQIIIIGAIVGFLGSYFGYVKSVPHGIIIAVGFAFSGLTFHWLRSNLHMVRAYIASGSWRFLFLLSVLLFLCTNFKDLSGLLSGSFLVGGLIIAIILFTSKPMPNLISVHKDILSLGDVHKIGFPYFLASFSLAISAYGENIVINELGSSQDLAIYFRGAVTFLFPGIVFNQYIGALFSPLIRQNEAAVLKALNMNKVYIIVGFCLLVPLLYFGGRILERVLYDGHSSPIALAVLLNITCCIRLTYIIPSSFISVVATKAELYNTSSKYMLCALMMPALSLLFVTVGGGVVVSIVMANLINWILRSLIAIQVVAKRYVV